MKGEFDKFLGAPEDPPPSGLTERIFSVVTRDLRVRPYWLAVKLLSLHAFMAAVTLSFCPQFNVGPVGEGIRPVLYGLMQIHPWLCAAFCGAVFLGSSALLSLLALREAELAWVKKRSWGVYAGLTAVSFVFFMFRGSLLAGHEAADFLVVWTGAALGAAWAVTRAGFWLRTAFF